jgi:hypothetical protein
LTNLALNAKIVKIATTTMPKESQQSQQPKKRTHEDRSKKEMYERGLPEGYGSSKIQELLRGWDRES